MANNKIIEKITKSTDNGLSSSDKTKVVKELGNAAINAMNDNSKDFKELCEVAKKELENNNPSDEYYKVIQKGLDLYNKAIEKADSEEAREKIMQEAKELIEKADEKEETRNINNKEVVEKVIEANKENRQFNWTLVRNLGVAVAIIVGGVILDSKGKNVIGKLIDKK